MALHLKATGIDFTDFGNTGNMTGELLDDYEEGTWGSYWTDGTNDSSTNTGQPYCRAGRMCQVDMSQAEDWDAHSCTGTAKIKGLPFNTLHQGGGGTYLHRYVTEQGYTLAMHHGGTTDEILPVWCRSGDSNLSFTFEHMAAWGAFDNYLGLSYVTV